MTLKIVLPITALIVLVIAIYHTPSPPSTRPDRPVNVVLVETKGCHAEVLAPLANTLGSLSNVALTVYQRQVTFQIDDIIREFPNSHRIPTSKPLQDFNSKSFGEVDIFVSTTCERDLGYYQDELLYLLETQKTVVFCIVHHVDEWKRESDWSKSYLNPAGPWIRQGRIRFITLASNTRDYFQNHVVPQLKWRYFTSIPETQVFVPVFPVKVNPERVSHTRFAIQGKYDTGTRDFKSFFYAMEQLKTSDHKLDLIVLGHGKRPEVPALLEDDAIFYENLPYPGFFNKLASSTVVAPAFYSWQDLYLKIRCTSAIPAALSVGVPIIADQSILEAYNYLTNDAVYFQSPNESLLQVMQRIIQLSKEEQEEKRRTALHQRDTLLELNAKNMQEWIQEAIHSTETTHYHIIRILRRWI